MLNSKLSFSIIGVLLLIGGGALWLRAQQKTTTPTPVAMQVPPKASAQAGANHPRTSAEPLTVGAPTTTPAFIVVNTPTTVTVTATVAVSGLIPNSVNLFRLGATGTPPTILGVMQHLGGSTYTIRVPFDETSMGQIRLEVSAAFLNEVKRVFSLGTVLPISGTFTPQGSSYSIGIPEVDGTSGAIITSTSSIAVAFPNLVSGGAVPTLFVTSVPLPGNVDLTTWFLDQSPANQELLDVGTYTLTTRSDGSTMLQQTGATPDDYSGGPLNDAYLLSPDETTLLIVQYNGQETPLPALGVVGTQIDEMFNAFLSDITFGH